MEAFSSSYCRVGPSGSRVLAVSKEVSGESEDNTASGGNGFGLVSEDSVTVAELASIFSALSHRLVQSSGDRVSVPAWQANSSQNQSSANALDDSSKLPTPLTIGFGSGSGTGGGTRAGLFRTPISGGVQSATSAHGLPRPALAVRNLMEQVKPIISLLKKENQLLTN
ncbi:hypothetical protein Ancab_002296 [Ancistrocladus abbreviatus]